jgi:hypothetical protein
LSTERNKFNPRIRYPVKLSVKIDRGIKVFHVKKKLKQNMTIKSQPQKILKGILHTEDGNKHNHERTGNFKPHENKRQVIRD